MNTLVIGLKGQQVVEAAHGQIIKPNRPCVLHSMTDFLQSKISGGLIKVLGQVNDDVTDDKAKEVWIKCGRDVKLATDVLLGKAQVPEKQKADDAQRSEKDLQEMWKQVEGARAEAEKAYAEADKVKADLVKAEAEVKLARADAEIAKAEDETAKADLEAAISKKELSASKSEKK